MNTLLQLEDYSNIQSLKDHVHGKLECVIQELDDVISLRLKVGWDIDPILWVKRHESSSYDSKLGLMQKDEIEVSKWLSIVAKRMEKIRMLVSQFSPQPEGMPPINIGSDVWEKRLSNTSACIDMCIEESLLISPMVATTLKKSYDHLPTNLKLCSLCLAVFPENFVIMKIPLIYWWMAEGFITETMENKPAEGVGEENFMELIRLGFIEPYYQGDGQRLRSLGIIGACRVHPWIRRMLVSIAMDTQFFEFYGRQQMGGGQEKRKISTSPSPAAASGFHGRPAHACLFWDEGAEQENYSFMRIIKILRWLKPGLVVCEKEIINKQVKEASISDNGVKGYRHVQEVWDMLFAFRLLIVCVSSKLDDSKVRDRISPWGGDEKHEALLERLRELETDIHQNEKDVQDLYEKQKTLQTDHNKVLMWAKKQVDVLEMQVYDRKRNRQELQRTEQLFSPYDLSRSSSSSSGPIHRQWGGNGKSPLLAIINVNQDYLNLEELLVFGGKLNKIRTLHLGMWNHWQHTIQIENSLVLNALFQVASKHLKYLSLRGVRGITSLPPSISNCCNLQILDLKSCMDLEEVPSEIGSLAKLTYFNVSGCSEQLKRTSLWAVVAKLKLLRTLKGVALTQDADLISLSSKLTHSLMNLSINVYFNFNEVCNLQRFSNLHSLKITWFLDHVVLADRHGFELPPQLRKLQLHWYPSDQNWPAWLKRHPTLETLYISYSWGIRAFPDDLMLPKLQVLVLPDLSKFDKSNMKLGMPLWFPSLKVLYDLYHSYNV